MCTLKKISAVGAVFLPVLLAGCAPQTMTPEPAAGPIPSVLLRSSQMAARAQQRVSEVLFVQSHPPIVAVAPSQQKAMNDRFHFHWEGPVNVVAMNLAAAMGWNLEFAKPQPFSMPVVYIDQQNSDVRHMVNVINRQIMPTALLRIQAHDRTLVLQSPTKAEIQAFHASQKQCAKGAKSTTQKVEKKTTRYSLKGIPAKWLR